MNIIDINELNIDSEHICCAIGNDKENKARALTKKEWMKPLFAFGLRFKRADERGKAFIEYMPVEAVWKPIVGTNYTAINCLWVSGRFKGLGLSTRLLGECVEESRKAGKAGIVVVSSAKKKPFLTDKQFFLKHGFEVVDAAQPYFQLLALRFDRNAPVPSFAERAKTGECALGNGLSFIYSSQCPFMDEYVSLLLSVAEDMNLPAAVRKLQSREDALLHGSPFGTLGIYLNGKFLTHELMTAEKFRTLIAQSFSYAEQNDSGSRPC